MPVRLSVPVQNNARFVFETGRVESIGVASDSVWEITDLWVTTE
jgi:hypothetical protein